MTYEPKTFTFNNNIYRINLLYEPEKFVVQLLTDSDVLSTYEVSKETYFDCKKQNGEDLIEGLFKTAELDIKLGIVKV